MKFIYIDCLGKINLFSINGLFLKSFFNLNLFYQFSLYYNSFYKLKYGVQKSRSLINYSTRKLYKQKGTGRARAGSASSHTRIKGSKSFPGIYFCNYKINFNKNSYKLSYFLIYCNLFFNNYFFLIEDFFFIDCKTKLINSFLKSISRNKKVFFLSFKIEKNFFLSLINIKNILLYYFFNFNPIFLLKFHKIFITRSCLKYFND